MRETLLKGIYSHFINNPDNPLVLALGGSDNAGAGLRYWPWGAQQNAQYPYAVSYIVSEIDSGAITGDISEFEWQMMIYTKSMSQGNSLAGLCKKLFNRQSLFFGDVCFTCIYNLTVSPMRESDTDPFQTTITFSCYIQE